MAVYFFSGSREEQLATEQFKLGNYADASILYVEACLKFSANPPIEPWSYGNEGIYLYYNMIMSNLYSVFSIRDAETRQAYVTRCNQYFPQLEKAIQFIEKTSFDKQKYLSDENLKLIKSVWIEIATTYQGISDSCFYIYEESTDINFLIQAKLWMKDALNYYIKSNEQMDEAFLLYLNILGHLCGCEKYTLSARTEIQLLQESSTQYKPVTQVQYLFYAFKASQNEEEKKDYKDRTGILLPMLDESEKQRCELLGILKIFQHKRRQSFWEQNKHASKKLKFIVPENPSKTEKEWLPDKYKFIAELNDTLTHIGNLTEDELRKQLLLICDDIGSKEEAFVSSTSESLFSMLRSLISSPPDNLLFSKILQAVANFFHEEIFIHRAARIPVIKTCPNLNKSTIFKLRPVSASPSNTNCLYISANLFFIAGLFYTKDALLHDKMAEIIHKKDDRLQSMMRNNSTDPYPLLLKLRKLLAYKGESYQETLIDADKIIDFYERALRDVIHILEGLLSGVRYTKLADELMFYLCKTFKKQDLFGVKTEEMISIMEQTFLNTQHSQTASSNPS